MGKITLLLFLTGSTSLPAITIQFDCSMIRSLYASAAGHSKEEMKDFLRKQGFSERRIVEAEKCIK